MTTNIRYLQTPKTCELAWLIGDDALNLHTPQRAPDLQIFRHRIDGLLVHGGLRGQLAKLRTALRVAPTELLVADLYYWWWFRQQAQARPSAWPALVPKSSIVVREAKQKLRLEENAQENPSRRERQGGHLPDADANYGSARGDDARRAAG